MKSFLWIYAMVIIEYPIFGFNWPYGGVDDLVQLTAIVFFGDLYHWNAAPENPPQDSGYGRQPGRRKKFRSLILLELNGSSSSVSPSNSPHDPPGRGLDRHPLAPLTSATSSPSLPLPHRVCPDVIHLWRLPLENPCFIRRC